MSWLNRCHKNVWIYYYHSCDIDLNLTHKKLYAIYIEWTKLSEKENHLSFTWLLCAVETVRLTLCYQVMNL